MQNKVGLNLVKPAVAFRKPLDAMPVMIAKNK